MQLVEARKLRVGDVVCDCRYLHLRIASLDRRPYDVDIVLEDGRQCSAVHCCDPVTSHTIEDHPPLDIEGYTESDNRSPAAMES